jgi:hypothetical protein
LEQTDVATLPQRLDREPIHGARLAAVPQSTLVELAEATGASIVE